VKETGHEETLAKLGQPHAGLWVFASPWALQHTMAASGETAGAVAGSALWNAVIVGALVVLLAGWAISPTRGLAQASAQQA
jgi:hypothetical protein